MRKLLCSVVAALLLLGVLFIPNQQAQAANVGLGVSKSQINIGDSVTVTVTIPENVTGTVDLTFPKNVLTYSSASAEVGVNGGTITMNIGKMCPTGSNKVTVTFKGAAAGIADVKVNVVSAYDNESVEDVALGGASAKVTVMNETTSTEKDHDNFLAKLSVTAGSKKVALSPAFKYTKTNYTATVENDVKSVVVSATRSSGKATIESITGNGKVDLKVGANVIEIVVKAENGKTRTYKITITRKDTTTTPEPPTEDPTEEPGAPDFNYSGADLFLNKEVPDDKVPADFIEGTEVISGGKEATVLSFSKGELKLLYLKNAEGSSQLYVYHATDNQVYPFVKLSSEKGYVMILAPKDEEAPEGYTACTFTIEGKGSVSAYQYQASGRAAADFYLLYCMNNNGEMGWYQYDVVEATYQRYAGIVPEDKPADDGSNGEGDTQEPADTEAGNTADPDEQSKYEAMEKQLKDAKNLVLVMICVIIFLVAVFVIVLVNILVRKNKEKATDDSEEEDEVEFIDL